MGPAYAPITLPRWARFARRLPAPGLTASRVAIVAPELMRSTATITGNTACWANRTPMSKEGSEAPLKPNLIRELTFPNHQNVPSVVPEPSPALGVPSAVCRQLGTPVFRA